MIAIENSSQLRSFRLNKGLSQLALSSLLGVTPFSVHCWETGKTNITRRTQAQLKQLATQGYCGKRRKLRAKSKQTDKQSQAKALQAVLAAKRLAGSQLVDGPFGVKREDHLPTPPQKENSKVNEQLDRIETLILYMLGY
jgi:transcriptional regulator with XRE-family HTH domain